MIITQTLPVQGQFQIQWQSVSGKNYDIDYSLDLKTWTNATTVTASSDLTTWIDDGSKTVTSPNSASQRFYRVKAP